MKLNAVFCTLLITSLSSAFSDFSHLTPKAKCFFEELENRVNNSNAPYFVILIPTYKNESIARKNLLAALDQKYDSNCFSILIINDCSPDNTGNVIADTLEQLDEPHHVLLIDNESRRGAMYNQYHAIHACPDNSIIIIYDGDDWFAHDNVLERIAQEYRNGAWLTYGQFLWFSCSARGICKPIPKHIIEHNLYRKHDWVSSHVRTFYAKLFKKIKQGDFTYNGKLLEMTCDVAAMLPMLEMAGPHAHFIDEILYIYNDTNPINDHKKDLKKQLSLNWHIRSKQPYSRLNEL